MLARRFTIVCLVAALFGMALAILVADGGRSRASGLHVNDSGCASGHSGPCLAPLANRYFAR
jgi:hypothetical protein